MRYLFRTLVKLILIAAIAIIAYNYFLGNDQEKQQSEKIVEDIKDVFNSVKDLAISEKEKYHEGKYDNLLDKLKEGSEFLKENIDKLSKSDQEEVKKQSEELEEDFKKFNEDIDSLDEDTINEKIEELLGKLRTIEESIRSKSND